MKRSILALIAGAALVASTAVAQSGPDTYVYQTFGEPVSMDPARAYDTGSGGIIETPPHQLHADGQSGRPRCQWQCHCGQMQQAPDFLKRCIAGGRKPHGCFAVDRRGQDRIVRPNDIGHTDAPAFHQPHRGKIAVV